ETALDLIEQLEARFPRSSFADEASIVRGYAALSNCDFEQARKRFTRFIDHFTPLADEVDRIAANPQRRAELYDELARGERGGAVADKSAQSVHDTLLSLVRVDPVFVDLHERVRKLDAEAARAGRVPDAMDAIAARLYGSDAPKPTTSANGDGAEPSASDALLAMKEQVADARRALAVLNGQLDAMRKLGAKAKALAPLEKQLAALAHRANELDAHIADARFAREGGPATSAATATANASVQALFTQDVTLARDFQRRVGVLRPKLIAAANERALSELLALRDRLRGFLRRARIGRIDAIMGSKRRIELQIEALSAGRMPADLRDPLRVQGFLADDEEYWPFEGEDWPDEYIENYPGAKKKSAAQGKGRGKGK
ncbi:MAG TPA: hypothetical protein VHM19_22615, partial [Polyangiales bacterium]|nr:hypothetical protein [Polyangiales bacterium]